MQTRELLLTELDTVYELIEELPYQLSYSEFEDTVYEMRHQEYKMFGVFECDMLVAFIGITIQSNLFYGKYLSINDFSILNLKNSKNYIYELLHYILDNAKLLKIRTVVVISPVDDEIKSIMIKEFSFKENSMKLLTKIMVN